MGTKLIIHRAHPPTNPGFDFSTLTQRNSRSVAMFGELERIPTLGCEWTVDLRLGGAVLSAPFEWDNSLQTTFRLINT